MGEVDHGLGTFQKWEVKSHHPLHPTNALYFGNAPTLIDWAFNLTQDFFSHLENDPFVESFVSFANNHIFIISLIIDYYSPSFATTIVQMEKLNYNKRKLAWFW
jgi:hypothetical protein